MCIRDRAREAGERGGTAPCILNAANEEAVAAFLAGRLPFTGIAEVVAATLEEIPAHEPSHFEDLFDCDAAARKAAAGIAERIAAASPEPAATNGAAR